MTNPFAMDPAPAPAQSATATATLPPPATVVQPVVAQPAAVAPAADPFGGVDPFANSNPAPQAPRGPRFRELYGRLVIIVPRKLDKDVVSQKFKNADGSPVVQSRLTADLIVLDGGTIHYGGRPEEMPPVPHDKTAEPPTKWESVYISYNGIISQCREALARREGGQPGMVLGRLTKGQDTGKGNPPWILTPATDADRAIGRQYLALQDPFA